MVGRDLGSSSSDGTGGSTARSKDSCEISQRVRAYPGTPSCDWNRPAIGFVSVGWSDIANVISPRGSRQIRIYRLLNRALISGGCRRVSLMGDKLEVRKKVQFHARTIVAEVQNGVLKIGVTDFQHADYCGSAAHLGGVRGGYVSRRSHGCAHGITQRD